MAASDATQNPPVSEDTASQDTSTYRILLAYVVLILLILLANKSRVGQVIIYYALILMVLFLIVTQYKFFSFALAPFQRSGAWLRGQSS